MVLIFEVISGVLTGVLGLLVMIIIIPVIFQIMIHMVINMINSTLKTNIRPMLNLLFFPGAIVRVTFMFLVLSLMGWKSSIVYGRLAGLQNPTSTNNRFAGFGILMGPPRTGVSFGQTIIISISGYFVWVWVLLFVLYQQFINNYMTYLWSYETANLIYFFILISFLVGGMPIPEETMLPLYHMVANYPHLIIASLLGFVGAAIVGGLYGVAFGQIYFMVLMALLISRHRSHAKQLDGMGKGNKVKMDVENVVLF